MKPRSFQISRVLALLCLTVFALCILLVLLSGASGYRHLVERSEASYTRRTALQYLSTRVRQAESVNLGEFDGCDALILEETVEGERYTTRVYWYEGWLRELYTVPGAKLPARAGTAILETDELSVRQGGNLLTLTLGEDQLLLYIPGEVRP